MANGYSSLDVHIKSTRLTVSDDGSLATTKLLVFPLDNSSTMIFSSNNLSIKFLKTFLFSDVTMMSISPDVLAPRRKLPTISNCESDSLISSNSFSKTLLYSSTSFLGMRFKTSS